MTLKTTYKVAAELIGSWFWLRWQYYVVCNETGGRLGPYKDFDAANDAAIRLEQL